MNGKGNYKYKEKEISRLISAYASTSSKNQSKVLYCFDCDDYDIKQEDSDFLKNVQQYCDDHRYDFIWFCKDVERVYICKKIDDSKKKNEAALFKAKKLISKVDVNKLSVEKYEAYTSNIILVLDTYLERK